MGKGYSPNLSVLYNVHSHDELGLAEVGHDESLAV
jgi:hypothetical protein